MKMKTQTIDLIAELISENIAEDGIVQLLKSHNILLQSSNEKVRFKLADSLKLLNDSKLDTDSPKLVSIIEDFVHPLTYRGNNDKSLELIWKINQWLIYDNLRLIQGYNKINLNEIKKPLKDRLETDLITIEKNGKVKLNNVWHKYNTDGPHFKILKALFIDSEEFFRENGDGTLNKDYLINVTQLKSWDDVRQKIRDIRQFHKINSDESDDFLFYLDGDRILPNYSFKPKID